MAHQTAIWLLSYSYARFSGGAAMHKHLFRHITERPHCGRCGDVKNIPSSFHTMAVANCGTRQQIF